MYTFVIRSSDRLPGGTTNDFKVRLPFLGELAQSDHFLLSVQRCVFPKAATHAIWYSTSHKLYEEVSDSSASNRTFSHEVVEVHIELGGACKGYDTQVGGGASRELVWGGRSVTGSGSAR
mgnify:CR=1 FL=1